LVLIARADARIVSSERKELEKIAKLLNVSEVDLQQAFDSDYELD
jgi:uncharacterized tellurite resistance protein B-like protein